MAVAQSPLQDRGYFLHRSGAYVGPFTIEELALQMTSGTLQPDDLVQLDGTPFWQRAKVVLADVEVEFADAPLALSRRTFDPAGDAPSWTVLAQWMALRIRREVESPTPQTLGVLLALGSAALFCSLAPWIFWLPWFALTLTGGVLLMLGARKGIGLLFALAAIAVPLVLLLPTHSHTLLTPPVPVSAREPLRTSNR